MSSGGIPKTQRALIVCNKGKNVQLELQTIPVPEMTEDEVLIHLSCTGICHADIGFAQGEWDEVGFGLNQNHILGHEGVGSIIKVGGNVKNLRPGERVGIPWVRSVCHECIHCRAGNDNWCPSQVAYGKDVPGSFQQYVTAPASYLNIIPHGLSDEHAAPLLCAGVTVYDALKKGNAKANDWVVVFGGGGGLGHLAIQFARTMRCNVIAIDSGQKKEACEELGANHFIDFTTQNVAAAVKDILRKANTVKSMVLALVGTQAAYKEGIEILGNGGTFVCVGLPPKPFQLPISILDMLTKGITVTSVAGSSRSLIKEALEYAAENNVRPLLKVYAMNEGSNALEDLRAHRVTGRALLSLKE